MNDHDRRNQNLNKLAEMHHAFADRLARVLHDMEAKGFRPRIATGWRSSSDQLRAFTTGHSHVQWGPHNAVGPRGEKESCAADVLDDDNPLAPPQRYCVELAALARRYGLRTGIKWGLPQELRNGVEDAIQHGLIRPVKIGFDPCHVEASIAYADLKAGSRPDVFTG